MKLGVDDAEGRHALWYPSMRMAGHVVRTSQGEPESAWARSAKGAPSAPVGRYAAAPDAAELALSSTPAESTLACRTYALPVETSIS